MQAAAGFEQRPSVFRGGREAQDLPILAMPAAS